MFEKERHLDAKKRDLNASRDWEEVIFGGLQKTLSKIHFRPFLRCIPQTLGYPNLKNLKNPDNIFTMYLTDRLHFIDFILYII